MTVQKDLQKAVAAAQSAKGTYIMSSLVKTRKWFF